MLPGSPFLPRCQWQKHTGAAHPTRGLPEHAVSSAGTPAPQEIPVAERPEDILLAVVGGVGRKSTCLPSWGATRAVTYPVALD